MRTSASLLQAADAARRLVKALDLPSDQLSAMIEVTHSDEPVIRLTFTHWGYQKVNARAPVPLEIDGFRVAVQVLDDARRMLTRGISDLRDPASTIASALTIGSAIDDGVARNIDRWTTALDNQREQLSQGREMLEHL